MHSSLERILRLNFVYLQQPPQPQPQQPPHNNNMIIGNIQPQPHPQLSLPPQQPPHPPPHPPQHNNNTIISKQELLPQPKSPHPPQHPPHPLFINKFLLYTKMFRKNITTIKNM